MSETTWVVDSSPFIALAQVGELRLLTSLSTRVVIPEQVVTEVQAGPADEAIDALAAGFGERRAVTIPNAVAAWGLGLGETAVFAVALELDGVAVVDDLPARRCARALGLPVIGTLGIVLRAKKQRLIPTAVPLLRRLVDAGLYLDDALLATAVKAVGETWPPT